MPPEIVLYALADGIALFMLSLIALMPAEDAPRREADADADAEDGQSWLMVPCWLI
jgi:hypothetical protein